MANNVQLGKAFVVVGGKTGPLFKALGKAEKRIERFGAKVGSFAKGFAALGTALVTPFVLATRTGLQFEKVMAEVAAVTGATEKEFKKLSDTARQLGEETSFTASEVSGAMAALGRAGFTTNEIIAAIPTTLNLARASGLGMAEVAEIMADVGRAFGIAATDIVRVADAITFTANNSTQNINQLSEAMKFVAPAANDAGQALETITSALGILANVGVKGSEAGTALSTVLQKLVDPKVIADLDEMNVKVADAEGNMRELDDILVDLQAELSKTSSIERAGILFELFQKRGFRATTVLTKMIGKWRELRKNTLAANEPTKTAAEIMEGKLLKSVNLAVSAFESLQITIKQAVQPVFEEWLETLRKTFTQVSQFVKENKELAISLLKAGGATLVIAAAFGTMAIAAKGVAFALAFGSSGISKASSLAFKAMKLLNIELQIMSVTSASTLIPNLGKMSAAFKGLTLATIKAKAASLAFKAGVFAGVIGPAVAATAAIGATIFAWVKYQKFLADTKALKQSADELERLNKIMKEQKTVLEQLDRGAFKRSKTLGGENKTPEDQIKAEIKAMVALGKTSKEINDKINKDIADRADAIVKTETADFGSDKIAKQEVRNNEALNNAAINALNARIAETLVAEKRKADSIFKLEFSLLKKTKALQKQFDRDLAGSAEQKKDEQTETSFSKALLADAEKTSKDVERLVDESKARLLRKEEEAQAALAVSRKTGTRDTFAATELAIKSFKDEEKNLEQLIGFRRRAADQVISIAEQRKQQLETNLAATEELQERINRSADRNEFISGSKSQFEGLTDAAQQGLQDIIEALIKLREQFAEGIIDQAEFEAQLSDLQSSADSALGAKKKKDSRLSSGTFGTFSAREAAGSFGKTAIQIAQNQLEVLKEIASAVKKGGTATFGG